MRRRHIMKNKILVGKFNSEKYWSDENYISLPSIANNYYDNIILAMDELLVPFCTRHDYLLTSLPMNVMHKQYLNDIGLDFENISFEDFVSKNFKSDSFENMELDTYADIPYYEKFAKDFSLVYCHAPMDIIKKVNSKKYSVDLSHKLGINNYSQIASDYEQLLNLGTTMFNKYGRIIVKEEHGVSGKGNLIFNTDYALKKFFTYVERMKNKGKKISFILEPLFNVKIDFSIQMKIKKNGEVEFISIQKIFNNGLSYNGSLSMDLETVKLLEEKNYFEIINTVCKSIYKDGYYGDVCIDSLITDDEKVVPVIEINARKSMSLIKNAYDEKLGVLGNKELRSSLFQLEFSYKNEWTFENILELMKRNGVLKENNDFTGVIPLTANTLFINNSLNNLRHKSARGRLYFWVVMLKENDIISTVNKMKEIFSGF